MAVGCSKHEEFVLSADPANWKENNELKEALKKLPEEDRKLAGRWMVRAGMGKVFGADVADTTLGAAIEKQKAYETKLAIQRAEEKVLAEKVAKERRDATTRMNAVLTVAMTKLKYHEANYRKGVSGGFSVGFALQNKSTKDLAGIKGRVLLADMFDDAIKTVGLSVDEGIPAGQVLQWSGNLDYNQYLEQDKKLRTTPLEKLKVSFSPEMFIFTDGSKMVLPK